MTAVRGQAGAVKPHVRTALRASWSRLEIGEILLHVNVYAGVYASLCDFMAAKEVFEEIDCQTTTVQTIRTGATVKHEGLRRVRGYHFSDWKSAEWSERT